MKKIICHMLFALSGVFSFGTPTYLRYPNALGHFWSLCLSALIPDFFLVLNLSPTKAWASPASLSLSSPSSSISSSAPFISAPIRRNTSVTRCVTSLSPAPLNSLCSWCRLTPVKMLEQADFLLHLLESFHSAGRPSSVEMDSGASAMLGGWRAFRW